MFAIKYSISILLLILSFKNFKSSTDAIDCVGAGDLCTFSNITTTETDPLFYPSSANPSAIKIVKFVNSSIYALTNELCTKFSKLAELVMEDVNLQVISDNGLTDCSKLLILNLANNKLKLIPGKLPFLKHLSLANNQIVHFPIHKMRQSMNMKVLELNNNMLVDLDVVQIRKLLYNLEYIPITGNRFDCDRLWPILDLMEFNNFTYVDKMSQNERIDGKGNIKGVDCVTVEDQIKSVLDLSLVPIYEEINELHEIQSQLQGTQKELLEMLEKLQSAVDTNFIPMIDNITKMQESQIDLQETQQELLEAQGHLQDEVKYLVEQNKNLTSTIYDMDADFHKAAEALQQTVSDINETFVAELKDFETQVIDVLNSKEDFSERIYYASICVLSIITFISVIVIGTLISLIWESKGNNTKFKVNDKGRLN